MSQADQSNDLQKAMERLRARSKAHAEHVALINDRITTIQPLFSFDQSFEIEVKNIAWQRLISDDGYYELFVECTATQEELGIDSDSFRNLMDASVDLRKKFENDWKEFLETGDVRNVDKYEASLVKYVAHLKDNLTDAQFENLKAMTLREICLRNGFERTFLRQPDQQSKALINAMKDMAHGIRIEGNRLFVAEIRELLPGFISEIEPENLVLYPLLPLKIFLEISNNPKAIEANVSSMLDEFEIDLDDGQWVFPGPTYRSVGGELSISQEFTERYWMPRHRMQLIRYLGLPLSESQRHEVAKLFSEFLDEANQKADTSIGLELNRQQRRKIMFERLLNRNRRLEEILLPVQIEQLKNYARIHSLFSIGPHAIWQHTVSKNRLKQSEFETKLAAIQQKIADFIKDSEERMVDLVFSDNSKGEKINRRAIESPFFSNYERLLLPILK